MSKDGFALVPSPNLFHSKTLDCNADGIIAYGTRHLVALINSNFEHPVLHDVFKGHNSRILAVAFCKHKNQNLLATGCEHGTVKIFDISLGTMKEKATLEINKINVLEWQQGTDHIVFIADEKAGLVEWNFDTNIRSCLRSDIKYTPLSLSSNAQNPNLLAVGRKGGSVEIFDVSKRKAIHLFKAHIDDVMCVSWSAAGDKLLSSSKDNCIHVWSPGTENPICTLYANRHHNQSKNEGYKNNWVCAIWHPLESDCIISSNQNNDVVTWNLNDGKKKFSPFSTKPLGGHGRPVFNITACSHKKNIVFSYSLDRSIVFWDVTAKKSVSLLPTINGFVYHLDTSKIDSGRLAIGVSDANLRIWNIANASNPYSMKTMWQGIKGKISVLSWHPTKESIIGFGTDEGRVCVIDIQFGKVINLTSQHKSTVYGVSWGPCSKVAENESERFLYSCGSGKILIHSYLNQPMEALNLEDIINVPPDAANFQKAPFRTDILWKPDASCVAVGCDDGIIDVYSGASFNLLSRLQSQKKSIQSLRWHPLCTTLSSESSLHTWLACSSNESTIQIYDLAEALLPENDGVLTAITNPTRQLCGHECRVVCVAWCTNIEGRLASASYDGTVQIWDALSGQPLVNFSGHVGRVFCVEFSILDPDVVFSGGEDFSVRRFRISEQTATLPPKTGPRQKKKKKKLKNHTSNSTETEAKGETDESKDKNLADQEKAVQEEVKSHPPVTEAESIAPNADDCEAAANVDEESSDDQETSTNDAKKIIYPFRQSKFFPKRLSSLFKVYGVKTSLGKKQDLADCVQLADIICENGPYDSDGSLSSGSKLGEGELIHLGFFGNQTEAIKMLDAEIQANMDAGSCENAFHLHTWKGDISNALHAAAEKEELSDLLVSLAPLGSHQLWLEMCEKYALQLTKTGFYQKAVLYLLACHKVYEAIDLLKDKAGCRYALGLAKVRLPSTDPVIKELTAKWSADSVKGGSFRIAAKCYISQNQPLSAAAALSSKPSPLDTQVSAYICLKYGHTDEAKRYALLCLKQCLLDNEWITAGKMISEQPSMEGLMLVVAIHESLHSHIQLLESENEHYGLSDQIFPNSNHKKQALIWKSYSINHRGYLSHLYHSLMAQGLMSLKADVLATIFGVVKHLLKDTMTVQTINDALYLVALNVTSYFLALIIEDSEENYCCAFDYLKDALNVYLDLNLPHVLNTAYLLLLPFDFVFTYEDSNIHLNQLITEVEPENLVQMSFQWFKSKVIKEGIFKLKAFPGREAIVHDKNTLASDLHNVVAKAIEILSATTIVDALLAFFAINFADELLKTIIEKNLFLKCHSDISCELENKEHISTLSLSCGTSENKEIDSGEVDKIMKELLSLVEEKRQLLISSNNNDQHGNDANNCELEQNDLKANDNVVKHITDEHISSNSGKECDMIDVEPKSQIRAVCSSKIDVELKSEETSLQPNNKIVDCNSQAQLIVPHVDDVDYSESNLNLHAKCVHVINVFLNLMPTLTSCICKDIYAIKYYLMDELKQVETSLTICLVNKNFKKMDLKKEIPSSTIPSQNAVDEVNGVIVNDDEVQENISTEPNGDLRSCDNKTEIENTLSKDAEPNISINEENQFSELKVKRDQILEFLNIIKEKEKVRNLPNPLVFISKIESICNLVCDHCLCPAIKRKMQDFAQQLTLWSVKFK